MNKTWTVINKDEYYSDSELKKLIKAGELSKDDEIYCEEMDEPVKIKDTIYSVFIKETK